MSVVVCAEELRRVLTTTYKLKKTFVKKKVKEMLEDIPEEALDLVAAGLDARSLARLGCVSRRCRDAHARAPLRLALSLSNESKVLRWAVAPSRRARVVSVTSSRRVGSSDVAWMSLFPNVTGVRFSFCRIMLSALEIMPCHALKSLTVHSLCPPAVRTLSDPMGPWTFSTAGLARFPCLEIARLTLTPQWYAAEIDGGPASLRVLELRNAEYVRLIAVPPVDTLSIVCRGYTAWDRDIDASAWQFPASVRRYRIECNNQGDIDLLIPRSVQTLAVSAPFASSLTMGRLLRLQEALVDMDFVTIDAVPPHLKYLEIAADRLATTSVPAHVTVIARVRGHRVDSQFFS